MSLEHLKSYQKKVILNIFKGAEIPIIGTITYNDILRNIERILNFVIYGDYAHTTKRDYLIVISNVFKFSNSQIYKYIQNEAKAYNDLYIKKELIQGLDEHEKKNYIKYGKLYEKVKDLYYTYLGNQNHDNLLNLLILGLYVLQPPLRNDYYNIIFIIDERQETDITKNYILRTGEEYSIILNKDKVTRSHGRGVIPIKNKLLKLILDEYIFKNIKPHDYLFKNKDGTPYTKRQIQYLLNQLFKSENKVLTIYNLRSAYISEYYNLHRDLYSRHELARYMRHSKNTAELIYYKLI